MRTRTSRERRAGMRARCSCSGLADAQAKLSVLLLGGKALTPREFAQAHHGTVIGGERRRVAPTGQCYPTHSSTSGTNRWATRLEGGISIPRGRWMFEGSGGVGLSGPTISSIRASATRGQQSIKRFSRAVSYTFVPARGRRSSGTWVSWAAASTWTASAERTSSGTPGSARLFALPLTRRQSPEVRAYAPACHHAPRAGTSMPSRLRIRWSGSGKRPTPPQVAPPPGGVTPH